MLAMGISTANANDVITSLAVRVCVDFTISAINEISKGVKKKNNKGKDGLKLCVYRDGRRPFPLHQYALAADYRISAQGFPSYRYTTDLMLVRWGFSC